MQVADQYRLKGEQRIQRSGDPVSADSLLTVGYYRPLQRANDFIDQGQFEDARQALEEITLEELENIIKKFKNRKAPGPDEVPMEVF